MMTLTYQNECNECNEISYAASYSLEEQQHAELDAAEAELAQRLFGGSDSSMALRSSHTMDCLDEMIRGNFQNSAAQCGNGSSNGNSSRNGNKPFADMRSKSSHNTRKAVSASAFAFASAAKLSTIRASRSDSCLKRKASSLFQQPQRLSDALSKNFTFQKRMSTGCHGYLSSSHMRNIQLVSMKAASNDPVTAFDAASSSSTLQSPIELMEHQDDNDHSYDNDHSDANGDFDSIFENDYHLHQTQHPHDSKQRQQLVEDLFRTELFDMSYLQHSEQQQQ